MPQWDVIVIGAGAAGLLCAIEAGKRGRRVLLLEHSERVGKKISISGVISKVELINPHGYVHVDVTDPQSGTLSLIAAGLVAQKAVALGLSRKPWVKTSLAPGSRVVTDYLDNAGLTPYLEKLGFEPLAMKSFASQLAQTNDSARPEVRSQVSRRGR